MKQKDILQHSISKVLRKFHVDQMKTKLVILDCFFCVCSRWEMWMGGVEVVLVRVVWVEGWAGMVSAAFFEKC